MNLKRLLLGILLLAFSFGSYGQDYSLLSGARSEGLAHGTVALTHGFSSFHNPSTLAWIEENMVSGSVRNHFGVSNLNSAYLSAAFNNFGGAAGLTVQWNGGSGYHDARFGIFYAKGFGEVFSASFTLNVYQHYIQGYDLDHAVTGDFGLHARGEKFGLGFYWGNLARSSWSQGYQQELPMYFRLGGRYNFTDDFLFTLEGVYSPRTEDNTSAGDVVPENELGLRTGMEYLIDDILALRIGWSNLPKLVTGGVGLYVNQFKFNVATSWHERLGFSPHAGVVYAW